MERHWHRGNRHDLPFTTELNILKKYLIIYVQKERKVINMTRAEKYPNTSTFHYYNANPKNRITGDCIIRAISLATEIPYTTVVRELAELQCETGYADPELTDRYLKSKGWIKHKQPRQCDGTKYTGKQFCKEILRYDSEIDTGNDLHHIIANIGCHHIVAIIAGCICDIWDSSDGCIGNYWTK